MRVVIVLLTLSLGACRVVTPMGTFECEGSATHIDCQPVVGAGPFDKDIYCGRC